MLALQLNLQKAIPSCYHSCCFSLTVRPGHSMSVSTLLHFICCKMSSIFRSNAIWKTMTLNKALCESIDDCFGRSTADRKGKSIYRMSISIRPKRYPAIMKVIQCNKYATTWLADFLWGDNISGVHCWSPLLAGWILSSDCSWISFGKWKPRLLSPCIIFTPATLATLSVSLSGKDKGRWQRG